MPMARVADIAFDAGAALGESPVWDADAEQLVWVDCIEGAVHRSDPRTGSDSAVRVGQPVGSVALRRRGGMVMAVGEGFAFLDERTGAVTPAAEARPAPAPYAMNDGACDVTGRFWAGTRSQSGDPTAGLYRFDVEHNVTRAVAGVRLSNGIGWNPDNTLMYYVDSRAQSLDVFEFHADEGRLGQRRRLVNIDTAVGVPDGLAVDGDGCIWLALWGPGLVHRYTPGGRLDALISVPAAQTTSCAFGGPALDVLYITSARTGLSERRRREQPHAGAVFMCAPGVGGMRAHDYAG